MPIDFNVGSESFEKKNMSELETGKTYLIKYRQGREEQMDYIGRFIRKNYSKGNFRFQILYSRKPRFTENDPYNKWQKYTTPGDNTKEFSSETEVFDLGEYGGLISYKVSPDAVQGVVEGLKQKLPDDVLAIIAKYLGGKRKAKRKTNRKTKRNYKNTKKNRKQYKR
jgi:hypothetical protein